MNLLKFRGKDIGIDLGTSSILVVTKEKGIVKNEPDIIAVEKSTNDVLALGREAKEMIGKTPDKIDALMPLEHAGISDLNATERILKNIVKELQESENIGNPRLLINLHIGMTEVEKRAVFKAALNSGARSVYFIEETIAAARGANLDINLPEATVVVDIGSGTTEVAILVLGKIVSCNYTKTAGDDLDYEIINYIKKKLNLEIGKNTAEKLKIEFASVKPDINKKMQIKGRDLLTGLPRTEEIDAFQINDAIRDSLGKIVDVVRETLDRTPPELINDIHRKGLIITGGGAYIDKIDTLFEDRLRIKTIIADNPIECVALGIYKTLNNDDLMKEIKSKRRM